MAGEVRHHRADLMGLSNWIPACAGMTCACGALNCFCKTNLPTTKPLLFESNFFSETNLTPTISKAHLMAGEVRHHRADLMGLSNWIPACAGMMCACGALNCFCKTNLTPTTSQAHLMAGEVRHHRADIRGVTEP